MCCKGVIKIQLKWRDALYVNLLVRKQRGVCITRRKQLLTFNASPDACTTHLNTQKNVHLGVSTFRRKRQTWHKRFTAKKYQCCCCTLQDPILFQRNHRCFQRPVYNLWFRRTFVSVYLHGWNLFDKQKLQWKRPPSRKKNTCMGGVIAMASVSCVQPTNPDRWNSYTSAYEDWFYNFEWRHREWLDECLSKHAQAAGRTVLQKITISRPR